MNHYPSSEELTDWDEEIDSCDEDEYIQSEHLVQISEPFAGYRQHTDPLIRPTLQRAKETLINHLITEFWRNFQNIEGRSNNIVDVMPCAPNTHAISQYYTLRSSDLPEENHESDCNFTHDASRAPKRLKTSSPFAQLATTDNKFACPYRKHDPKKYCLPNWGPCALTSLQTVARLKAHLYRYHRVHQCPRCKEIFNLQEEVDVHVEAAIGCEPRSEQPVEGVTSKLMERLRSRKKTFHGQTETERWKEVYELLFPNEAIPNPYFEPIRDHHSNAAQQDTSQQVAKYEDYLRQELPKFFKNALDSAVSEEMQPIEERVSRKMMAILEEAQNLAFSTYHSIVGSDAMNSPLFNTLNKGSPDSLSKQAMPTQESSETATSFEPHQTQPLLPELLSSSSNHFYPSFCDQRQNEDTENATRIIGRDKLPLRDKVSSFKTASTDAATDPSSNPTSPSSNASQGESSTTLPDTELSSKGGQMLGNIIPVLDEFSNDLDLFSHEWVLNGEEINIADFNWIPSWETITAGNGG